MARSTFHDQFHRLEDKGYLVPAHGNTYDFYEVPRAGSGRNSKSNELVDGHNFENYPTDGKPISFTADDVLSEDIEIDNTLSEDDLTNIRKLEEQEERMRQAESYYLPTSETIPIKHGNFYF